MEILNIEDTIYITVPKDEMASVIFQAAKSRVRAMPLPPIRITLPLHGPFKIPAQGKRKLSFKTQRQHCKNWSKKRRHKSLVVSAMQRHYAPLFEL